jgi:hypothetical protein
MIFKETIPHNLQDLVGYTEAKTSSSNRAVLLKAGRQNRTFTHSHDGIKVFIELKNT